jgi:hypothetical protein
MSKTYIGTKLVKGDPMDRQAYNDYRGWVLPADENGADAGYLVEYLDGGKPNHPDHAGYISWSPAEQFENANILVGKIDHLPPHEQRMVAEAAQINDRIQKLEAFMLTPLFASLAGDVQKLRTMQLDAMKLYGAILGQLLFKFEAPAQ